jgi:predicted AlkP superfamily phosphohydrolase/phosphomutase
MLAGGLVGAGCASPSQRIILVAIDGADWEVIDHLVAEDKLPHFKKIREQGKTGVLVSDYSSSSPAIWNSIATGVHPQKHGITTFLARSENSYYEIPVTRYNRKSPALWNILSHYNHRVAVVAWWASWPAEPVNGTIVTQRFYVSALGVGPIGGPSGIGVGGDNPHYLRETNLLTWPEELAEPLRQDLLGRANDLAAGTELGKLIRELRAHASEEHLIHDLNVLENILVTDLSVGETARYLEESGERFDFLALYFEGVDVASHLFWKYRYPEPWLNAPGSESRLPSDYRRYAPVIELYYKEIDRVLGRLLDRAGPEVMLMLASDHGFQGYKNDFDYNYPLNTLLEEIGYLVRESENRIDYTATRVFDYANEPWERNRIVYLNLKGKYPQGTVEPEEAPTLLASLKTSLEALRTTRGETVILRATPSSDDSNLSISINPRLQRSDAIRLAETTVPVSTVFPPRTLSGNHRPEGIVGFYGGGIRPEALDPLSSLDVTPTLLAALGLSIAEDMDGEPCLPVVEDLGGHVSYVADYQFLVPENVERTDTTPTLDDQLKERLRSLGYIQ